MSNSKPKLYYFVSDVHLGLQAFNPEEREKKFANFLHSLPENTDSLYLLGDIFDFWYEYKYVIPRGFSRTLGALGMLYDRGVKVFFIRGNHDVWTYNFLQAELGIKILEEMSVVTIDGKSFCLAHGDELTGEKPHLFLKKIFKNRFLQTLFSAIHPRWAFAVASRWSKHNRLTKGIVFPFKGVEASLYSVALEYEKKRKIDYFIFGHIHTPGNNLTPGGAGFYILGEWIHGCDYLVYNSAVSELEWRKG